MPNTNLELRSEAVQNIIGYIPHWIIRWGITVIFLTVLVLLVGSWFFKYPDVIAATIVVTTDPPPASIVAKSSGKLAHFLVEDTQAVNAGDVLIVIENPANYHHVIALKKQLATFKVAGDKLDLSSLSQLTLGELQTAYTRLKRAYADYHFFLALDYHQQKIQAVEKQIETHQQLLAKAETGTENLSIQMTELEKSVLDLQLQYRQQKRQLQLGLTEAYDHLVNQIETWEHHYVLKSPLDGTVTLTQFWTINQPVKAGEVVMMVVPETMGKLIGKARLPIPGAGKVQTGQPVMIKFANYPYMEYGTVSGVVKQISLIPDEAHYVVEVGLENELISHYGKVLAFKPQMPGTAEIITEEMRLLERFFKPILSLFKKPI
jgi:multidrug resistance efflux pump